VQMVNSKTFGTSTATLTYTNDATSPCPTTPTGLHILP
jgi:hypothetical protein